MHSGRFGENLGGVILVASNILASVALTPGQVGACLPVSRNGDDDDDEEDDDNGLDDGDDNGDADDDEEILTKCENRVDSISPLPNCGRK